MKKAKYWIITIAFIALLAIMRCLTGVDESSPHVSDTQSDSINTIVFIILVVTITPTMLFGQRIVRQKGNLMKVCQLMPLFTAGAFVLAFGAFTSLMNDETGWAVGLGLASLIILFVSPLAILTYIDRDAKSVVITYYMLYGPSRTVIPFSNIKALQADINHDAKARRRIDISIVDNSGEDHPILISQTGGSELFGWRFKQPRETAQLIADFVGVPIIENIESESDKNNGEHGNTTPKKE